MWGLKLSLHSYMLESSGGNKNESNNNIPKQRSLDIGPPHVDAHVAGLVQQDVVLGAGAEAVAEPHTPDYIHVIDVITVS